MDNTMDTDNWTMDDDKLGNDNKRIKMNNEHWIIH